jgi:hypothetical protein
LIDKRQTHIDKHVDGADALAAETTRVVSIPHCNMEFETMTSYKMTYFVDKVAMTLINVALLAALPMGAALFISHSL